MVRENANSAKSKICADWCQHVSVKRKILGLQSFRTLTVCEYRHSSHGSIAVRLSMQYAPDRRCVIFRYSARLHMGILLGLVGDVCSLGGFEFVMDVQRHFIERNLGFANIRHNFCVLPLG